MDNYRTKIEVGPYLVAATDTSVIVLLTPKPHRGRSFAMRLKGNQQLTTSNYHFNNSTINNSTIKHPTIQQL